MTASQQNVLIVTQNGIRGGSIGAWLQSEGYAVTCVNTFSAARLYLQMSPSVVITDLKLGAYNGLHLAFRAKATHIPIIVLGERDAFFENEARRLGTTYIAFDDVTRERIVACVGTKVQNASASQDESRWIGDDLAFPSGNRRLPMN